MPVYEVTKDGVTLELEGDQPPTKDQLDRIFSQYAPQPVDYQFSETRKNFLPSLGENLSGMAGALLRPDKTGPAMADLASGIADKAGVAVAEMISGQDAPDYIPGVYDTRPADAFGEFYKDRYGSVDAIKRTAMEDPAGMMFDATAALSPASRFVPAASKVAAITDPINTLVKGGKAVVKGATEFISNKALNDWYKRAAKFTNTRGIGYQDKLAETAVREGIMPTAEGIEMLYGRINILGQELKEMIDAATEAGKTIPIDAVFTRLNKLREDVSYLQLEGGADKAIIDAIAKDFSELAKAQGRSYFTPTELLKFKRRTQHKANYNENQLNNPTPQVVNETRQAVARSADDALDNIAPGSAPVNERLSELIELVQNLDKGAGRISNHNLFGLTTPLNLTAGTALGGPVGGAAATLINIMRNPKVAARTAIALRKLKDGDVEWLRANANNQSVRSALYIADNAEEILSDLEANQ